MLKQKTVYFREEDLEAWEKISNKAQWLHDNLEGKAFTPTVIKNLPKVIPKKWDELKDEPLKSVNIPTLPKELTPRFCPNGHAIPYPKDRCLGKGCKYS